jgi:hypothetical protein
VKRFLHEKSDDRHKVVMTIDDVEHRRALCETPLSRPSN